MTMIIKCDCKSEYQDEKYGKQNRVHNESQAKDKKKARCTVCSKVKDY